MQPYKAVAIIILASSYIRANDCNSIDLYQYYNDLRTKIDKDQYTFDDIKYIYILSHNEMVKKLESPFLSIKGIVATLVDPNDSALCYLYTMAFTQAQLMDRDKQMPEIQNLATFQPLIKKDTELEKNLLKTKEILLEKLEKEDNQYEKIKIGKEINEIKTKLQCEIDKRSKNLAEIAYEALQNFHKSSKFSSRVIQALGCLRVIQDNAGIEINRLKYQVPMLKFSDQLEKFFILFTNVEKYNIDSPIQIQKIRIRIAYAIECLLIIKPSIQTKEIAEILRTKIEELNNMNYNLEKHTFKSMINDLDSYILSMNLDETNIETDLADLKEACKNEDKDDIQKKTQNLIESSMKIGDIMYKDMQANQETSNDNNDNKNNDDDATVDADYKDLNK